MAVALTLPLLLFLTVPLLALFVQAPLYPIPANLATPQVRQAFRVSMETSLTATARTVTSSTPVAYLLARHRLPMQRFFETILDLPLVLPPAVPVWRC